MTKSVYELFVTYEGQKFVGDQFHHFETTTLNSETLEEAIQESAEKLVEDRFWKEAQIRHVYSESVGLPGTVEKYFFRNRII